MSRPRYRRHREAPTGWYDPILNEEVPYTPEQLETLAADAELRKQRWQSFWVLVVLLVGGAGLAVLIAIGGQS